ncbi:MAG TPA: hypothetical protein VI704_07915 [Bacteroidota bacterium]|nr:hypothetical protein [Bacteroidota bacterium]
MTAPFPKGRTAFLVIHGIGEQVPFETLDSFARGVIAYLQSRHIPFTMTHKLSERLGAKGSAWTESFVRLSDAAGKNYLDIHEYYWAYITEEQIKAREVYRWVAQALDGAMKYARQDEEIRKKYEGGAKPYWWRLLSILRWMRYWHWAIRLLLFLLPSWSMLDWLREKIEGLATNVIEGYIGDVAIYTTTDEKSRYYKIRQEILLESQKLLESLLVQKEYGEVLVAGHSLGSAIAYDTLNRLNIKANLRSGGSLSLKKLTSLVTFGSPLDKIAFFFREQSEEDQYIRSQIIEHLNSFKAKPLDLQPGPVRLINTIENKLNHVKWINFYDDNDPVSGHLDFYVVDENIKLDLHRKWGLAHVAYWKDRTFYEELFERLLNEY